VLFRYSRSVRQTATVYHTLVAISLLNLLIGINEIALQTTTFSLIGNTPEPFDIKELIAMLEKQGIPQGIVLLPSGSGFDVYQFPSSLLRGAISLMHGKVELAQQQLTAPCQNAIGNYDCENML
jgi:hypothetical protein